MSVINSNSIALLISTYNWSEGLNLVLKSVLNQDLLPAEILIADDGSNKVTAELIDSYKDRFSIPVKHFWHEDKGFRKTIIMNKAIAGTECDYIIQIDGDIVLHPSFISDHLSEASKGVYVKGSRAMLTSLKTKEILAQEGPLLPHALQNGVLNKVNAMRIPGLSVIFSKISSRSDNFRGCNCAFWKEDFVKVNGYNNDLLGWGHEDIELAARFINLGLHQKQVKMKAVCFHLYHPQNDRHRESANLEAYRKVVQTKVSTCKNGYLQIR